MADRSPLKAELEMVEQLIVDASSRARALEMALGAAERANADAGAADLALIATLKSLALHTRRRATLLRALSEQQP